VESLNQLLNALGLKIIYRVKKILNEVSGPCSLPSYYSKFGDVMYKFSN